MKRLLSLVLVAFILCGCDSGEKYIQRGLQLRERLLAQPCSFVANITADYGDKIYTFALGCTTDTDGNVSFIVIAPESIAGIAGSIKTENGYFYFDEAVLAFPLLADGEVSPISAPWLMIKSLRSGYLSSAGMDGDLLQLTLNDTYEADALQVDVWLDETNIPRSADVLWQGRSVLSLHIEDFTFE